MAYRDPNSDEGFSVASGGFSTSAAGMAVDEAMKLGNAAIQYFNQKALNRQAQHMTRENMKLQKKLNLEQQYQSIANSTSAYKAAGLNPALATGAPAAAGVSMASGNAGSAALPQSPDVAAFLGAGAQLDMLSEQKRNLEANTNLQNEEAREKKIVNDRRSTEDSVIGQNLPIMLSEIKESTDNPFMRGFIESFEDSLTADDLNLGVLEGFSKMFFDFSQRERDRELDNISKELDKKVLSQQYENGAAEALADLPKATRFQIYRNVALMEAQIGQLNAETSLTEDKRNAIRANISKLAQEVQSLLHHDPAAMWHAGDISGLLVMLGYDGVKAVSTGAGFAVGARAAGAGSSGAVKAGTLPKPSFPSPKPIKSEPFGKPVPRDVLESIREATHATGKGNKVYEAQLFNAAVRRWKALNGYK